MVDNTQDIKRFFFFLKFPTLLPVMTDLLKEINLSKESL